VSRTAATTGDPTTKLSVSVPTSIKAALDRETVGANQSQYVTAVLAAHFADLTRNRIHAGAALLADELGDDAPDDDYLEMRRASRAPR
jgi:hypothetical protein